MKDVTKLLLVLIAIPLWLIAAKLYYPSQTPGYFIPTRGDMLALRDLKDNDERQAKSISLRSSLPLVHIQGGDVDVRGSVSVDGPVSIDN